MKADFEKGTKICPCCMRELSIDCFYKDKSNKDGLRAYCKKCVAFKNEQYRKNKNKNKNKKNKILRNVFQRKGKPRGGNGMLKRDYELTTEQLKIRERNRKNRKTKYKRENAHGLLVWYDEKLNDLSSKEYARKMYIEYNRQRRCAVLGKKGKKEPSEHFLFDFDLEQMLKDRVYDGGKTVRGRTYRYYITKWWKGEIRHWTVNDGIWREQ